MKTNLSTDRNGEGEWMEEAFPNRQGAGIDSPASNNMQLIYRLACQQAEPAGGEK